MKIAVALFGERVSPHFSTAPELLVLVCEGGRIRCSWKAGLQGFPTRQRVVRLVSLGVDVLVCGGIERATQMELERRGIRVFPNLAGDPLKAVEPLVARMGTGPNGSPSPEEGGHGTSVQRR